MNERPPKGNPVDEPTDPELTRLYRDSAREEPPPHVDAAVRAAARREAGARPRALATPFLRSWRLPMSIAAVVVLSVSVVALMVEKDRGRLVAPPQSDSKPMADSMQNEASDSAGGPQPFVAAPRARDRREAAVSEMARREASEQLGAVRQQVPAAAPPLADVAPPARSGLVSEYEHQPPQKWGEKIVELRQQGRSLEADELLAEFRRRFPGYPVPVEWLP